METTRKILFRGQREDNGKWVKGGYDYFYANAGFKTHHYIQNYKVDDDDSGVLLSQRFSVIPKTVGQYTGLNDSTKWAGLSSEEKKDFYYENCSENGETIKYQHLEDVKHLWKGKKIFESDIVHVTNCSTDIISAVIFENGTFALDSNNNFTAFIHLYSQGFNIKKIGNIFDNPELLE